MKFNPLMVSEYKGSDPITSFALKELKKGNQIDRESAVKVAICVKTTSPELDLDSICEGLGIPECQDEVAEACASSLFPTEVESAKKSKAADIALSDFLPETPSTGESDLNDPTDPSKDVSDIYYAKYSFVSRTSATPHGNSDENIAYLASACVGKAGCRRIRSLDKWLKWNGSIWKDADEGDIRQLISKLGRVVEADLKMVRQQYRKNREWVFKIIQDRYGATDRQIQEDLYEQEVRTMQGIVSRMQSMAGMQAVVKRMGDMLTIDNDDLNQNTYEIVFANTVWNAEKDIWYKPRLDAMATRGIRYDWTPPSQAAIDRWRDYLQTFGFDENTLAFVKRSFGYASLGLGTVKRFWWFRGVGGTSKTTLIQLVARCMDRYAETTQTRLWLTKGSSQPGHTDDLAALQGARLVYADEFPRVSRFDDSMLKQITSGGAPMRASFKSEKGFTYRITFAAFFSSNFDPHLSEEDEAAMTRLTTITFSQKVAKKDVEFVNKYVKDNDNRMAILQWIMEGAREYLEIGLENEPELVKTSRQEFTANQVSIMDQIEQLVVQGPTGRQPLRMYDILAELTRLQTETRQKGFFSTHQIAKIIKEKFNVVGRQVNGHLIFDGLMLRGEDRKRQYSPEIDYGYEDHEETK